MTADVGAQLRKGVVEPCVLGLLAQEPMYGWQLSERLTSAGLIASIGTLYPVLGRLRDRGLVAAFERATHTGPVRKYYRLTPEGEAALVAFRDAWAPFTGAVAAMLATASAPPAAPGTTHGTTSTTTTTQGADA